MTTSDLQLLLDPKTIAVVGASADGRKHGARVVANLRNLGFDGTIWGVNPSLPEIESIEVFASMTDLPAPPDLVVAAVPARAAVDVVGASAGAGGVIVFAAGFGESGQGGLEEQLRNGALSAGGRGDGSRSTGSRSPDDGQYSPAKSSLDLQVRLAARASMSVEPASSSQLERARLHG